MTPPPACISWTALLAAMGLIERRTASLKAEATRLVYAVHLFQRECPSCQCTRLVMIRDGWCRCHACGKEFDATVQFQTCATCDGPLILRVCRYWCPHCRVPVRSQFRLDAHIFDAEYFREKMRESRVHEQERVNAVVRMLANARSSPVTGMSAQNQELTSLASDVERFLHFGQAEENIIPATDPAQFDMARYRQHLHDLVDGCVVAFDGVSQLSPDPRRDRVWRFIAAVFMDQEGTLCIHQEPDGRIVLCGT